jgi:hypothetical protein
MDVSVNKAEQIQKVNRRLSLSVNDTGDGSPYRFSGIGCEWNCKIIGFLDSNVRYSKQQITAFPELYIFPLLGNRETFRVWDP